MEKDSKSNMFLIKLDLLFQDSDIPEKYKKFIHAFYTSYRETLALHHLSIEPYIPLFCTFIDLVKQQLTTPYTFQPYHERIRAPFDYYTFGIDFLRPLVDKETSSVQGLSHLDTIATFLRQGHNVILFANHQIEADPLAISLLLEKTHPEIAAEMVFVSGQRVLTDPLAIPFSMGINLLCIYSKRYIDHPPEQKLKKQLHNKKTMELMRDLLKEGGKCIYVAPSGGRDRPNAEGIVEVAPFDPQSIEMFYLMAQKAKHPTHFFPLALATYDLLPPPETVQIELGEHRVAKRGDIHLAFGSEIDMKHFPGSETKDKHLRRQKRAEYIFNLVRQAYLQITGVKPYEK
jgi:glycerol-3-phosphate O-acyltransferase